MWWPRINIDAKTVCQNMCTMPTHVLIRLQLNCIQSLSLARFGQYQIGVDLCSLPHTDEGFVCVCVVVDYFSKWVEAKPLKAKTAHEVAVFLYELICRHGCTCIQINDQGRKNFAMKFHILN